MAYVRQRTTKAGSLSTALVEAYRDAQGRPRQRLLVNMHGEPDVVRALVKAVHRQNTLEKFIAEERAEIKTWEKDDDYDAEWVARYLGRLGAELDGIKREIEVLSKHCTASKDEIRAATRAYASALNTAIEATAGAAFYAGQAEYKYKELARKLRRLRS
jgi:hypothetical protein